MLTSSLIRTSFLASAVAIGLFAVGCSGNTAGSEASDEATAGATFQADSSNTGGITLNIADNRLNVSETTTFSVSVDNASGQGIPQIRVACDSEQGIAIIEPSTGLVLTDSFGDASGVLGCSLPGSFQVACRTATGANRRVFQTVVCDGPIPSTFTGFPGAAGGGLFGGVSPTDDEVATDDRIEIVAITTVQSAGNAFQIDLEQITDCDTDPDTVTPEPYGSDLLAFTLRNNGATAARFINASFSIAGGNPDGSNFSSGTFFGNVDNNGLIEVDGELGVSIPFTVQTSPKTYAGASSTTIPTGFRTLVLRAVVELNDGSRRTLTARLGLNFAAFNLCPAS